VTGCKSVSSKAGLSATRAAVARWLSKHVLAPVWIRHYARFPLAMAFLALLSLGPHYSRAAEPVATEGYPSTPVSVLSGHPASNACVPDCSVHAEISQHCGWIGSCLWLACVLPGCEAVFSSTGGVRVAEPAFHVRYDLSITIERPPRLAWRDRKLPSAASAENVNEKGI
jgi:hypothetical protein